MARLTQTFRSGAGNNDSVRYTDIPWWAVNERRGRLVLVLAAMLALAWAARLPAQAPVPAPLPAPAPAPAPGPAPQPLTLPEAVAYALAHNPSLLVAGGQVAEAQARTSEARAAEGTHLNLSANYSIFSQIPEIRTSPILPPLALGNISQLIATLSAQKVIYSGGRLPALVRQASDLAHAAEATCQRTRQQVAYDTAHAFEILVAAQREHEVAQQTLDAALDHLHDAQLRFEARAAAQVDVLRAQVDVETGRRLLISSNTDIQVALDALLQAMGVDHGSYTAVEAQHPAVILPPVDEVLTLAYTNRPELRAFNCRLSAAAEAIIAARAGRSATLSAGLNYQVVTPPLPTQLTEWSLVFQANLPLLDAGLTKAQIREAEAQRAQVLGARIELINSISADVRDAYTRVLDAVAQVEVSRRQVALAEETMRIARIRYQGGVATSTEIADTQQTLTQARQRLVLAQATLGIAQAQINFAAGTLVIPTADREAPK